MQIDVNFEQKKGNSIDCQAGEPPAKLRKVEKIRIIPILDPKLTCETVPSVSFQAIKVKDKRIIGKIIKHLDDLPEELQHLKRVGKDGRLLLAENEEKARIIVDKLEISPDEFEFEMVEVPSIKPITRRQFENAKLAWPTAFHPDKKIDSLLDFSFITEEFTEYVTKWFRQLSDNKSGCIAVQDDEFLSEGTSSTGPLRHSIMEMVGRLPKREASSENYLGTGCDVFLLEEPCAMCAMALVHFRIKRVFFLNFSANGVFNESGWQLHLEPLINHHYEVFRVELDGSDVVEANNLSNCGSLL